MPAPANSEIKVSRTPQLTWIPGRDAVSHDVYLGTQNPPQYRTSTTDATYIPDELASNTQYYWRVDAVTADSTITGPTWTFHTETDQAPPQATDPLPANGAVDVPAPVKRLDWEIDQFQTDTVKLYFGTTPDNLTLKDTYVAPGYKLGPLSLGTTYYWRVDLVNQYGTTEGEVWNFTVESSGYDEADYVQSTGPDGIVSMEAEDYTDSTIIGNHQWTVVTNPEGYSGDGAMQVLPADGSYMFVNYASNASRLDSAVDFKKTGTHYIWVRSLHDNGTNNSIHLGVNGEPLSGLFHLENYDSTHVWEWINDTAIDIAPPAKFEIKSYGIHGINLWYGKGGAIADKIVITTSPDYVPEGFGPDVTTGLDGENASSVPNSFHLSQNYPNPFNPSTRIDFSLPEETDVKISVYDLTGRLIKIFLDHHITTGEHTIQWNGRNQYQQLVPSVIYFYEIRTDSYQRCKKMVLLR